MRVATRPVRLATSGPGGLKGLTDAALTIERERGVLANSS